MSDTIRRILKKNRMVEVDDTQCKWQKPRWCVGRRLRPYIRPDVPYKGKYEPSGINFNYRGSRLAATNANRNLKKSYRQYLKRDLQKQLTNAEIR